MLASGAVARVAPAARAPRVNPPALNRRWASSSSTSAPPRRSPLRARSARLAPRADASSRDDDGARSFAGEAAGDDANDVARSIPSSSSTAPITAHAIRRAHRKHARREAARRAARAAAGAARAEALRVGLEARCALTLVDFLPVDDVLGALETPLDPMRRAREEISAKSGETREETRENKRFACAESLAKHFHLEADTPEALAEDRAHLLALARRMDAPSQRALLYQKPKFANTTVASSLLLGDDVYAQRCKIVGAGGEVFVLTIKMRLDERLEPDYKSARVVQTWAVESVEGECVVEEEEEEDKESSAVDSSPVDFFASDFFASARPKRSASRDASRDAPAKKDARRPPRSDRSRDPRGSAGPAIPSGRLLHPETSIDAVRDALVGGGGDSIDSDDDDASAPTESSDDASAPTESSSSSSRVALGAAALLACASPRSTLARGTRGTLEALLRSESYAPLTDPEATWETLRDAQLGADAFARLARVVVPAAAAGESPGRTNNRERGRAYLWLLRRESGGEGRWLVDAVSVVRRAELGAFGL